MRVFVAGASGAIGTRLVPQLIDAGHEVIGTFRSPGSAERLRALGTEPVVLDCSTRVPFARPSLPPSPRRP
jgi:2-alkyl-3-oxoalkanoate reductase